MTSINCVWFCLLLCHSCNIFGLLRLEQQQQHQLVEALPFEYFEEHDDDFNYDLDEAQSQAKYDARLLSEQMLSDAELQQRADINYNSNLNTNSNSKVNVDANTNLNGNSGLQPAENRGEQTAAGFVDSSAAEDDLEPHSRAAACFTNGHKYTHGQKVPRLDACEVCLCMDGEIFCWWEKCDKTNVNSAPTGDAGGGGEGDYSDPYRHETTTRKSTKLHKAERKVGKRHKHHKNQKNFNDYEVYHSRQQQQQQQQQQQEQQAKDYKKPDIKQQKQKSSTINSSSSSNYNIIKQHQHEQQPKLATSTSQQQQQQKQQQPKSQPQLHVETAAAVNQAAKETHYQHQLPAPQQHELHEQQQQQTHQQHEHEQQQHLHAHQPHSSSKILNFPENLPALLYYDYKTEEHEHHQHQHHQQHLLHEKQRQQQQQQQQQQQLKRQQEQRLQKANRDVELATDLGSDKNFDEAETDSDILPEPPTKRPTKPTATTTTALTTGSSNIDNNGNSKSHSNSNSSNDSSNSNSRATTIAVATTIEMMTTPRSEHAVTVLAMANTNTNTNQQQQQHRVEEIEDTDDAFHRWLTSTELNVDSTNTLDDNLPAVVVEQETPASTIIDDVGVNSSSSNSNGGSNRIAVNPKDNGNRHGNNIADNADAVFFRSSYNDYSSEFNGSVVNIDITLTAVDVHPQRPHQQQKQQQQPKAAAIGQTDLIANDNQTSDVHAAERQPTMEPATATAAAAASTTTLLPHVAISSSSSSGSSNQHNVPPYTLTTIITTTPLATGRMCNVLGKLYKIGEILPQDTGNCLQCICTDAVTPDELPSVTCSPHNCPPLVLPDLFDATGY